MPIPLQSPVQLPPYVGDGVQTAFPFGFYAFEPQHVFVTVNGVEQTSGYTVTLAPDRKGGTLTFAAPPAAEARIVVYRRTPTKQEIDFQNYQNFYPEVLEDGFDYSMLIDQEQSETLGRAVVVPPGSDVTPEALIAEVYAAAEDSRASAGESAESAARAASSADRAANEAGEAASEADRAASEAGEAASSADRAADEADRAEHAADAWLMPPAPEHDDMLVFREYTTVDHGNNADTALLLHFDGDLTNSAVGALPQRIVTNGELFYDTARKRFGSASLTAADSGRLQFYDDLPPEQSTVREWMFYAADAVGTATLLAVGWTSAPFFYLQKSNSVFTAVKADGGATILDVRLEEWNHFAVVKTAYPDRVGYTLALNGVPVFSVDDVLRRTGALWDFRLYSTWWFDEMRVQRLSYAAAVNAEAGVAVPTAAYAAATTIPVGKWQTIGIDEVRRNDGGLFFSHLMSSAPALVNSAEIELTGLVDAGRLPTLYPQLDVDLICVAYNNGYAVGDVARGYALLISTAGEVVPRPQAYFTNSDGRVFLHLRMQGIGSGGIRVINHTTGAAINVAGNNLDNWRWRLTVNLISSGGGSGGGGGGGGEPGPPGPPGSITEPTLIQDGSLLEAPPAGFATPFFDSPDGDAVELMVKTPDGSTVQVSGGKVDLPEHRLLADPETTAAPSGAVMRLRRGGPAPLPEGTVALYHCDEADAVPVNAVTGEPTAVYNGEMMESVPGLWGNALRLAGGELYERPSFMLMDFLNPEYAAANQPFTATFRVRFRADEPADIFSDEFEGIVIAYLPALGGLVIQTMLHMEPTRITVPFTPEVGHWHTFAVTGCEPFSLYVDGVRVASIADHDPWDTNRLYFPVESVTIAIAGASGHIDVDELLVASEVLYTGESYDVPAAPFGSSAAWEESERPALLDPEGGAAGQVLTRTAGGGTAWGDPAGGSGIHDYSPPFEFPELDELGTECYRFSDVTPLHRGAKNHESATRVTFYIVSDSETLGGDIALIPIVNGTEQAAIVVPVTTTKKLLALPLAFSGTLGFRRDYESADDTLKDGEGNVIGATVYAPTVYMTPGEPEVVR